MKPHNLCNICFRNRPAAFRRLCVETVSLSKEEDKGTQPPSGGCVLKLKKHFEHYVCVYPAAFRRLCVETPYSSTVMAKPATQPPSGGCVLKQGEGGAPCTRQTPAAFGRLCVETTLALTPHQDGQIQPLSGGCVLKQTTSTVLAIDFASRLQATAC